MGMFSIICIYDNRKDYNEKLGHSLILLEDCAYELIVKKRVGDYLSNLREAIEEASNDLIVVINEKVELPSTFLNELKAFEDMSFGVVGVRGRKRESISSGKAHSVGDEVFLFHKSDYLQFPFDSGYKQHYLIDFAYAMMVQGKENYVMDSSIEYRHRYRDDPVIISHLRKKYPQFDSIDTMNDFYPVSHIQRVKKLLTRLVK